MSVNSAIGDESCTSPETIRVVSAHVTDPDISRQDVIDVLSTIAAIESGNGPKPESGYQEYLSQLSRFSGVARSSVQTILKAYVQTLAGLTPVRTDAADAVASQPQEQKSSKFSIGLIATVATAILTGVLVIFIRKQHS
jgi:hypothetical protein